VRKALFAGIDYIIIQPGPPEIYIVVILYQGESDGTPHIPGSQDTNIIHIRPFINCFIIYIIMKYGLIYKSFHLKFGLL
jgi:hypothetical protein